MFFESILPKSLGAANVTEIALSARKLINDSKQKRIWDPILKGVVRSKIGFFQKLDM